MLGSYQPRGLRYSGSWSLELGKAAAAMFPIHSFLRRDAMPIYISRGRFTSDAIKSMLAKPENREEAVSELFESVRR
jgi:hypothetical protein